jgi:predicted enzyme related to lactoylglutathione lyase
MDTNGNARSVVPKAIGYVALWSDQPERLRDFFSTMFHYEVVYEDRSVIVFDMEGETDLIIQRVDEATVHLNGTTQFGLYVEDMAKLTETLQKRGVSLSQAMTDLGEDQFLTLVQTPTGHTVELVGGRTFDVDEDGDEWGDLDDEEEWPDV